MTVSASTTPGPLPGRVLVLDADQPASLAVVRSLARLGLRIEMGSADSTSIGARSRHVSRHWLHPDPLLDAAAFVDWLARHLRDRDYDMVVPLTERSVIPLAQERHHFGAHRIAVPEAEALAQVVDKQRTVALARALGVPVPGAEPVGDVQQALEAAGRLGYPVVVKPARSVGNDGGRRLHLTVSYAFDANELARQVESALRFGPVMLQEYFEGDGVGIELIADQGELRYTFQHRRLHEVPLTGGGSSLRISELPDPALVDAAARLIRALRWHGVAMVEFKRQPATGAFRLMEINGRFWGSLPLAVAAGADFPAMLHALVTTGQVGQWPPARPGIVCRQLARDVLWLEHVLRRNAPEGLVRLPSRGDVLRDSLMVFSPRHRFDVQSWRDPWPGLVDGWRIVRHQWRRIAERLAERTQRSRERRLARSDGRHRIGSAGRVLFLCYGNINRSALAHAYAMKRYGHQVSFDSAGFHGESGRPADPTMAEIAREHSLTLEGWSSRTLSAEMVENADVILAMELAHLQRLERDYPQARGKSFLLGAAAEAVTAEDVPDPYGQPRDTYARVSRQVFALVDRWLAGREKDATLTEGR